MSALEEKIGYNFRKKNLMTAAMTHSSYANENRSRKISSNERLEFLGDSILSLVTSDYIFKLFRDIPEGELTKLRAAVVCEQSLVSVARELGLSEYMLLGRGEEAGGGRERPSILADAVEALIGAIYMDRGLEHAAKFVLSFIKPGVESAARDRTFRDYKTMLQEIVQRNREETLSYGVVSESGPDHDKTFEVEVMLNSNVMARGRGRSKKEAEQSAARAALRLMGVMSET